MAQYMHLTNFIKIATASEQKNVFINTKHKSVKLAAETHRKLNKKPDGVKNKLTGCTTPNINRKTTLGIHLC